MNKLNIGIEAALLAGDFLLENYGKLHEIKNKESHRDVVTEIDKASENIVIETIKRNDDISSILAEETGVINSESKNKWIIDALDGTVNYIHSIPFFSISISYWKDQEPKIGVIYNPYSKELFYSESKKGSYCNQKKIFVSKSNLNNALTAMAFSGKAYNPSQRSKEFEIFSKLNDSSQGCLRTGSAAMNLANLACGKFSFVLGKANKIWDVAAGLIIAKEAGAEVKFKISDDTISVDYICSSINKDVNTEIDLGYLDL